MTDMTGKTVVITGGNSGIGKETAVQLAAKGATTVITSRDATRGAAAVVDIAKRAGAGAGAVSLLALDLGSFTAIRAAAAELLAGHDKIDVLINNAGSILTSPATTKDGFEATVGVNHLGHFLFTSLLLDRLRATGAARVVVLSSIAHRSAPGVTEADFSLGDSYRGMGAYSVSKLANVMYARELARRETDALTDVTAYAVHPGGVRSGFGMDGDAGGLIGFGIKLTRPLAISSSTGAGASVYCASEPGLERQSGGYFQRAALGNWGPVRVTQPSVPARDDAACSALWDLSEKLIASVG